jgi:hypothetical protein
MAIGHRGGSIRSVMSRTSHRLPRLRMAASSRKPGSASPPTTSDPPGGASWWSQRTTHRGSARRIPRKHVGSKPTQIAPSDGRRSSARRHPHAPAIYISSSMGVCRCSTATRPTWVRCWHVFSMLILCPRSKQPWPMFGSPLLWWRRRAQRPSRLHLRLAGTRAADLIGPRTASSPRSRRRSTSQERELRRPPTDVSTSTGTGVVAMPVATSTNVIVSARSGSCDVA